MTKRDVLPWLLLIVAALVPWLAGLLDQGYYVGFVRRMMIFAIAAASLNFIMGYGGMVSLGHAAFFGIGAYTVGIAMVHGVTSAWIAWPLAMLLAALAALAIGSISLRTRGVYFIMITLAFAQMVYYLAVGLKYYGGEDGLNLAQRSVIGLGLHLASETTLYYVVLVALATVMLSLNRAVGARYGRVLMGIRESFDGSTLCATSYTSTCDNTWTVAAGTPDFDCSTSPAPIEGTYSLNLPAFTNVASISIYKGFTATDGQPQEAYFKFIIDSVGSSSSTNYNGIADFTTSGGSGAASFALARLSGVSYLRVTASGGTPAVTAGTLSTDTVYHCWVKFLKGTVSNAFASIAFSTDGVRPTSGNNYAESTNGTGITNAGRLYLKASYTSSTVGIDMLYDHVRVDDATIGNNPS